jgi:hypothetical protein
MFFPFIRIFPMHLTIIFGATVMMLSDFGVIVLILFSLLKTVADLTIHLIEHFLEDPASSSV